MVTAIEAGLGRRPPLARRPRTWHTLGRRAGGCVSAKAAMSRVGGGRARNLAVLFLGLALAGCAAVAARVAVPEQLAPIAVVPGMETVRVWGDASFPRALLQAEFPNLKAKYDARAKSGDHKPVSNLLAISGGADDGAFGAGLLVGWTERGDRPEFDLVTGISAGALIAPFAYLGRDY